jgi:phage FluMu protein Com
MGSSTFSDDGPKCPKCGEIITPDDPMFYDWRMYTEEKCPSCKTKYKVEVITSTTWRTYR